MAILRTVERKALFTTTGAPTCTPGTTKCVGYDLYTCSAGRNWELTEHNAAECGYVPPTCAIDADCPLGYKCVNGKCVKITPTKKFPWEWVVAGGLGLAALILLASKKEEEIKKKPKS